MQDLADLNPFRPFPRRALLKEKLPISAVRITFHHHGAIGEIGQQNRRYVVVILQQLTFGNAFRAPEELIQIGKSDDSAAGVYLGLALVLWNSDRS